MRVPDVINPHIPVLITEGSRKQKLLDPLHHLLTNCVVGNLFCKKVNGIVHEELVFCGERIAHLHTT